MPRAEPRRSGFILAYVLFALALLSIVIAGASQMAGNTATQKQIDADVERIVAGARLIRMQLLLCAAIYPLGANVTLAGGTGSIRTSYPVVSMSGVLQTGNGDASGLVCPGAPAGSQGLWSGSLGGSGASYLPEPTSRAMARSWSGSDWAWAAATTRQPTAASVRRRGRHSLGCGRACLFADPDIRRPCSLRPRRARLTRPPTEQARLCAGPRWH